MNITSFQGTNASPGYHTGHHIAADGGLGLTTAHVPILLDLDRS